MTSRAGGVLMTHMTHTPGPWHAEDWGDTKIRAGEGDTFVATITPGIPNQSGPNARLIAAAPDMLAAMLQLDEWLREFISEATYAEIKCKAMDDFRAAIAKATGNAS